MTLAEEVEAEINKDSQVGNNQLAVTLDASNKLKFTSQSYGAASQVKIGAGTALAALGLSGTGSGTGQHVAGHFLGNGAQEHASRKGQHLTGYSASATAKQHQAQASLRPTQTVPQTER